MSINKFILVFLIFPLAAFAQTGTLFYFEYPTLLILESKEKIHGYYESILPKIDGIRSSRISCIFFLYAIKKPATLKPQYAAQVFFTKNSFKREIESFDSPASIYRRGDTWFVQMENQDASCDGPAGWDFRVSPDDPEATRFDSTGVTDALYLRLVAKKSSIFFRDKKSFIRSGTFLSPRNVVAILSKENSFSKVRFLNSTTGKITEGWVKSEALVNPFPD